MKDLRDQIELLLSKYIVFHKTEVRPLYQQGNPVLAGWNLPVISLILKQFQCNSNEKMGKLYDRHIPYNHK